MPRYVLLATANSETAANIVTWGSEGANTFTDRIKQAGGQVVEQYVVAGRIDHVSIVDFEDHEACIMFSLMSEAGGLYVEALPTISLAQIDDARSRFPLLAELRTELDAEASKKEA